MPPVTTNLDQADIDAIDCLAEDEDMTRSAFLRRAILEYLETREEEALARGDYLACPALEDDHGHPAVRWTRS